MSNDSDALQRFEVPGEAAEAVSDVSIGKTGQPGMAFSLPRSVAGTVRPASDAGKDGRRGHGARLAGLLDRGWLFLLLVLLIAALTITHRSQFATAYNVRQIAIQAAPLIILAVGQTFVMISGGIDLSIGSVLVASGVASAITMKHLGGLSAGWGAIVVGVLAGIATGTLCGAINGILIARLRVPALIVTLGTLGMVLGLAEVVTHGLDETAVPNRLQNSVGYRNVVGIPVLVIIALIIALIGGLLLQGSRFGRHTYAIGSNIESARRAGIAVTRRTVLIYALQGFLAGVAGILCLAHYGTTLIAGHGSDNLTVITGVILGGCSLFGGTGTISGTVIGVLIPAVVANGLIIIGTQSFWQQVVSGAILIGAVYFDQIRRRAKLRA
jgi:ribose transport system permease protein